MNVTANPEKRWTGHGNDDSSTEYPYRGCDVVDAWVSLRIFVAGAAPHCTKGSEHESLP
jgi:hypothetical protein